MPNPPTKSPRLLPALFLILLAPAIAEGSIGTAFVPSGGLAMLTLIPIYGGGALLIREVAVRRGVGYAAIAVLGIGYGIVEEGLALGSFFSPTIYGGIGPAWGGRFLELNTVYTLFQLLNHSLFSVAVPILLVDLCFPSHQRRPWLKTPGLVLAGLLFVLGCVTVRFAAMFSLDPGYRIPGAWAATAAIATGAVVMLGLTRRSSATPTASEPAPGDRPNVVPLPRTLFAASLLLVGSALAVLGIGGDYGLLPGGLWLPATAAFLGCVVAGAWLVRRWSRATRFDDRHRLALGAGALLAHSLVLGAIHPATPAAQAGVAVVLVVTVGLLALLWHYTGRRATAEVREP
jgi:hypothetical protein